MRSIRKWVTDAASTHAPVRSKSIKMNKGKHFSIFFSLATVTGAGFSNKNKPVITFL
jgi:hypothetical protein